jgi:hypothetical protein
VIPNESERDLVGCLLYTSDNESESESDTILVFIEERPVSVIGTISASGFTIFLVSESEIGSDSVRDTVFDEMVAIESVIGSDSVSEAVFDFIKERTGSDMESDSESALEFDLVVVSTSDSDSESDTDVD